MKYHLNEQDFYLFLAMAALVGLVVGVFIGHFFTSLPRIKENPEQRNLHVE